MRDKIADWWVMLGTPRPGLSSCSPQGWTQAPCHGPPIHKTRASRLGLSASSQSAEENRPVDTIQVDASGFLCTFVEAFWEALNDFQFLSCSGLWRRTWTVRWIQEQPWLPLWDLLLPWRQCKGRGLCGAMK